MIEFYSENDFVLDQQKEVANWITSLIHFHAKKKGELVYVFCDDAYLHKLNVTFLNHDTLTDIISFDNSVGNLINGEIYISTTRVAENATTYNTTFINELHRVMAHGILHFCGFKDKNEDELTAMRSAEDEALRQRDFL